jgi:carotenoid cleavage dioxygenase-like enzyme
VSAPRYARLGLGGQPLETTSLTVDDLPVSGRLPEWLHGTLLRNGPGTFQVGRQRYRHWFDGLAMLHRFTIADSRVSYANRFLESRSYDEARATGRIAYSEFATDPCRSMFARVQSMFDASVTDSAKVNVARLNDRFLALAETPIQVEFDPETLRSVGVMQHEAGSYGRMTTVHPHTDPATKDTYNLVTRFHASSEYRFYRSTADLAWQRVAGQRVAQPAYLHSFGMSSRYLVLAEYPLVVNPMTLLLWLRPFIENFRWRPERGARFVVFDRASGQRVLTRETEAFFAFHHVNCFEDGDDLVVDLVCYPDADVISAFYLERLHDPDVEIPFGQLRRYRLPLRRGKRPVSWEQIGQECLELPSYDYPRLVTDGLYRHVYGVSISRDNRSGFYNQIVALDLQTRQERTWHAPDQFPGEPVFVGRPGRTAENDGVLLSVVLDVNRQASALLVLDAATLDEVARADLPHPVLFGYHGLFVSERQGPSGAGPSSLESRSSATRRRPPGR